MKKGFFRMKAEKLVKEASMKNKNLYYKLNLVFGLFFLFPVMGFLIFGFKYDILQDHHLPLFFLGVLVFSYLGFTFLRKIFDEISKISRLFSDRVIRDMPGKELQESNDELQNIVHSFNLIENQFKNTFRLLEKKSSEISILKELSELCYVTFDPEEILYVLLERSLILTKSDVGSVLILEKKPTGKQFTVKASIGLGKHVKLGDKIPFETSIAKYAVINKSPLVVEDIEKDTRFGRRNKQDVYATKSFVCMPIKTSNEILGVITLSNKKEDEKTYGPEDIEILTPLMSNAAFTYENLRLMKENDKGLQYLKYIDKIFKIINSSFRDTELLRAVLREIQSIVPFEVALVLLKDESHSEQLCLFDHMTTGTIGVAKGMSIPYENTVMEKVLKQDVTKVIEDVEQLTEEMDRNLFVHEDCLSAILTPLRIDGSVRGLLVLVGRSPEPFNNARSFIEWMANGISLAIDRNKLTQAVIKRNREMDSIRQIGRALASSTFDIEQVLKYTMDMIRVIMNVEAGSLLLLEGNELVFAVAFNIDVEMLKKFRLKLGQGIAGYSASRGESIIVNDVSTSLHFFPAVDNSTGFETRSALCVPMISQGKVLGVLEVLNKISGEFGPGDEDLLQSIASSVSIAIENARLYKETVSMAEHERGIRRMFQKFVPKEVLDKIIHGSETGKVVLEEVKTLTLLNIDVRGFSKIARRIGPQKTVFLLNSFFSVMGGIVFKHHGIVDKYLGDGFLAIFGAPVSSTRDADNAVEAALEMQKALGVVNKYLSKELGEQVAIGISLHTGEAVVGNIGFEMKMDYTVIGDSVNIVFRLQEMAKPVANSIVISEKTCIAARSRLVLKEIGVAYDMEVAIGKLRVFELLGLEEDEESRVELEGLE